MLAQKPSEYIDEVFTDGTKTIEVTYDYIIETEGENTKKVYNFPEKPQDSGHLDPTIGGGVPDGPYLPVCDR